MIIQPTAELQHSIKTKSKCARSRSATNSYYDLNAVEKPPKQPEST